MPIPLIKEQQSASGLFDTPENCYFCKKITRMWHENTNNPVCEQCAKKHRVSELPDYGKIVRSIKRKTLKERREAGV